MSARIDAATLLERALLADGAGCGVVITVQAAKATGWASATFVGARHRMSIVGADSVAVGPWLAGLPDADLPLRGHLVADLAVIEHARNDDRFTATIEVLTVEEA